MSESNCGCSCAYQTPPWWVTMRFTDAGPGAPAAPPATQPAQPQQPPPSTTSGGGDSGLGGILNTVGGALGGVLGGLI
jgi:hypothetical protein